MAHQPEQPPEIKKSFPAYPYQIIAIPLLFLIPLLAVFGVIGAKQEEKQASNGAVQVSADYPARTMYHMDERLLIVIENTSDAVETIQVRIDTTYLNAFTNLMITPSDVEIRDDHYEFTFDDVGPGESREVLVHMSSDEYGWHPGTISVSTGTETLDLPIDTLTYP